MSRLQSLEEFKRVHDIASLEILDAFFDRTMQGGSLFIVQVVATPSENVVDRDKLDLLSLRQIRRLVEHEPALSDARLQWFYHRLG
jgi:hypothetical protein